MSQSIEITSSNFQTEVAESDIPVLLDMWAAWCGPCRMVSPIVDELGGEYAGRIKVGKLDVDAEPGLAASFGVASIPTIVLIKDGQVVAHAIGARPKAQLAQALRLDEFRARRRVGPTRPKWGGTFPALVMGGRGARCRHGCTRAVHQPPVAARSTPRAAPSRGRPPARRRAFPPALEPARVGRVLGVDAQPDAPLAPLPEPGERLPKQRQAEAAPPPCRTHGECVHEPHLELPRRRERNAAHLAALARDRPQRRVEARVLELPFRQSSIASWRKLHSWANASCMHAWTAARSSSGRNGATTTPAGHAGAGVT